MRLHSVAGTQTPELRGAGVGPRCQLRATPEDRTSLYLKTLLPGGRVCVILHTGQEKDFTPRERYMAFPSQFNQREAQTVKLAESGMEGRVSWYKPGTGRGGLVTYNGRHFSFKTPVGDSTIHGGARVAFQVSETDGQLVGVNVRVIESCVDALVHENEHLAREFHSVVAIET